MAPDPRLILPLHELLVRYQFWSRDIPLPGCISVSKSQKVKLMSKFYRGIVNTFGVYQTFYQSPRSVFSGSPSSISWIGSTEACLLMLVSSGTGPLYDAGYFRHLVSVGSFLVVCGMVMTSISKTYWEVMLAQVICIGIGCGCLFVPSVAIVPTYFSTKTALATGIAASGSSLGMEIESFFH